MAKPEDPGKGSAPGQQQVLHVQNTDPTKPAWVGTKQEYMANKKDLQAQGYYLSDEAPSTPPAPTPYKS